MLAIFKKELRSYFLNAIGYVYAGVFLTVSALICCFTTLNSHSYNTSTYFYFLIISFIILIPLLTMKLFAEEKKLRTEQLLLTAPVSCWGMVLGKFLAAFTLFLSSVLVSCVNFIPLAIFASRENIDNKLGEAHVGPVAGMIIGSVVGVILIGAAFIALGMFISALTENQLAAAIITVSIIAVMLLLNVANGYIQATWLRFIIDWVCFLSRFSNFQSGLFDPASILYYFSFAGVFLLFTVRVYEKRRWA